MSVMFNRSMYESLRKKDKKPNPAHSNKEKNSSIKKICAVLQKPESSRTVADKELLQTYSGVVKEASLRLEKRQKLKDRLQEVEDSESELVQKCQALAHAVTNAKYLVVYTGAGISTAARIPDYRGTSGIWTLLQQGKDIGMHDLTQAEPTYTHMALAELHKRGKLKYVVSQNCDGLHLRSGLSRRSLSEVHGNMYIEVCKTCKPVREYLRLFDVTENTGRYSHKTLRRCYHCNSPLTDSIVHFGERGNLPWPLNWSGACKAAERADVILCIGSSLKVLKKYPWLWSMDKPQKQRPLLYIINLQWTPKDCHAAVKINGRCDNVMKILMKCLKIRVLEYRKQRDPIFEHATLLCKEEEHTTNQPSLKMCEASETAITGSSKHNNKNKQKCKVGEQKVKIEIDEDKVGECKAKESKLLMEADVKIESEQVKQELEELAEVKEECEVGEQNVKIEKDEENGECKAKKSKLLMEAEVKIEREQVKQELEEKRKVILEELAEVKEEKITDKSLVDEQVTVVKEEKMDTSEEQEKKECQKQNKHKTDVDSEDEPLANIKRDLSTKESLRKVRKVRKTDAEAKSTAVNDTGQASKEECIVITIKSEDNYDKCCQLNRTTTKHDEDCMNHDKNKLPVTFLTNDIVPPPNMFTFFDYNQLFSNYLNYLQFNDYLFNYLLFNNLQTLQLQNNINNTPVVKKREVESSDDTSDDKSLISMEKCNFCFNNYKSNYCLFYKKYPAEFKDLTKGLCECCTDEDEVEDEDVDDKCKDKSNEQTDVKVVNPGWYGKGCRKKIKKKR